MEERQGVKLQEKFASTVAAVCGLGGLGSNIALSLARAGIGKLILIDFDQVDVSNLHRQQYKASQVGAYKTEALTACLKEIAPYIELETHTVRMTEANTVALLKDADVICEALLVNIVLEQMPSKYLVAASGMAGIDSANLIQTRKVMERFYLCGDEVSEVSEAESLLSSRVMLCAAHQAHMVLRILAGEFES